MHINRSKNSVCFSLPGNDGVHVHRKPSSQIAASKPNKIWCAAYASCSPSRSWLCMLHWCQTNTVAAAQLYLPTAQLQLCNIVGGACTVQTRFVAVCCSMLQSVAVCCSMLQCVAMCCSVFERAQQCAFGESVIAHMRCCDPRVCCQRALASSPFRSQPELKWYVAIPRVVLKTQIYRDSCFQK